ncbi:hypothetical protein HOLleu_43471 [Holothuria leucospilota]|uniref:Uncharacterized protein n=1 Tax=Holothuria leucospilota TaxID=206669 RepID=A0A9Q0Y9N5_HOLLE|nr:hypothetical protein HOLleu_43471 [Holothuria leucospilota]
MGQCKVYPGRQGLIGYLHHCDDLKDTEEIAYKQWADFGLAAEWNSFATSHGKIVCDGIGGTVKRLVTKASLQHPYSDQILTSEAIMDFCTENIPGIKLFF